MLELSFRWGGQSTLHMARLLECWWCSYFWLFSCCLESHLFCQVCGWHSGRKTLFSRMHHWPIHQYIYNTETYIWVYMVALECYRVCAKKVFLLRQKHFKPNLKLYCRTPFDCKANICCVCKRLDKTPFWVSWRAQRVTRTSSELPNKGSRWAWCRLCQEVLWQLRYMDNLVLMADSTLSLCRKLIK